MLNSDKKRIEQLFLEYFKEQYYDYPKGKLVHSESPDFILRLSTKQSIGIELTSMFCDKSISETSERGAIMNELVEDTLFYVGVNEKKKLYVILYFSPDADIRKDNILSSSVKISRAILNITPKIKQGKFFKTFIEKNILPEGIDAAMVFYHPVLESSIFEKRRGTFNSEELLGKLEAAIKNKEEKLKLYSTNKLDAYWLIVTCDQIDNLNNYHRNVLETKHFNYYFHKVFLFDLPNGEIFELKK